MPQGFHGYGYDAWMGGPGSGWSTSLSRGRAHRFHEGSGLVGHRLAGQVTARPSATRMGQAGPGQAGTLKPVRHPWLEALGKDGGSVDTKTLPRSRMESFSQERSIPSSEGGDSLGEIGPGNRTLGTISHRPLGGPILGASPYPNAISTTATMTGLPRGARPMGPGSRPMGMVPTPIALPAQAGAVPPTRPGRSRRQSFGQLMFGQS
jgi:hypothetical protein